MPGGRPLRAICYRDQPANDRRVGTRGRGGVQEKGEWRVVEREKGGLEDGKGSPLCCLICSLSGVIGFNGHASHF